MRRDSSKILSLSVDSLGHGEFRPARSFPLRTAGEAAPKRSDAPAVGMAMIPDGGFRFKERSIGIVSTYSKSADVQPIRLRFDPESTHATLLGEDSAGQVSLPALLHLPEQGSLRIEAKSVRPVKLGYDAHRKGKGYVEVTFPAATPANPRIRLFAFGGRNLSAAEGHRRRSALRRLPQELFECPPGPCRIRVLANNAASDPCAFVVYMYSESPGTLRHWPRG